MTRPVSLNQFALMGFSPMVRSARNVVATGHPQGLTVVPGFILTVLQKLTKLTPVGNGVINGDSNNMSKEVETKLDKILETAAANKGDLSLEDAFLQLCEHPVMFKEFSWKDANQYFALYEKAV